MEQRRYPIGIQTFEDVRKGGYLYVDKTEFVHRLAHGSGKYFLLRRPRRFGKSLLLSTMQAYFEGHRELFAGLAVASLEGEWEASPVIRLDLSSVKTEDPAQLIDLLDWVLAGQERAWGRDEYARTPGSRLSSLIQRVQEQTGKQAVLLVDEYDAPLLNVVHDESLLRSFRATTREFYAPLKSCDADLRFVFLTGITKFSQPSIFSELNNLRNISMEPAYASICGITEAELTGAMASDLEVFSATMGVSADEALARLKRHYDGYHFCAGSPDIYNPFSLLNALNSGRTKAYWFESGTPTALINLLERHAWDIAGLEGCVAREDDFDAPTERMQTPLPMLYQGGYLTIKGYNPVREAYTLGIPNEEVRRGLSNCLVRHAAPEAGLRHYGFLDSLADELNAGDVDRALQLTRSYLAGIPYHLGSSDERGFQTTFFLIFDLLGIQIEIEFRTATGRVDAVVRAEGAVFVFEFRYGRSAAEALAQIDDRGYMVPFEREGLGGRRLVKAGVSFSEETRTIEEWIAREA